MLIAAAVVVALVVAGGLAFELSAGGCRERCRNRGQPHVRRQRNLRRLPPRRGGAVAHLAAQARDGPRDRENGARRLQRCGFDYYGVRSRFFRKDGRFLVETDGPDGKLATFEVKYTFGVDPLQQYLIEFPDGRLQALSIAWDSRPKDKGGQRWFHLYPNEEIRHDDVLHWTKLNQNWNFMCAECHSTGVRKNYERPTIASPPAWAEISVGCETCHGQGSRHVAWARERQSWWPFGKTDDPRKGLRFASTSGATRLADRSADRQCGPQRTRLRLRKEVETCGLCHARRGAFSEDWVPGRWLSDTHRVSPLARGLYHADGQMLDEVYNYGSFKQSKMFAAGVTCSDCHEPHGAKLRMPAMASVCNVTRPTSTRLSPITATRAQTRRSPARPATCRPAPTWWSIAGTITASASRGPISRPGSARRMPATTVIPIRRRTGRRRPSSAGTGRAEKASRTMPRRSTPDGTDQTECRGIACGRRRHRSAPAFARATALSELTSHVSPANIDLARKGLTDPDPMVRIGGLDMLESAPAPQIWPLVSPLLVRRQSRRAPQGCVAAGCGSHCKPASRRP